MMTDYTHCLAFLLVLNQAFMLLLCLLLRHNRKVCQWNNRRGERNIQILFYSWMENLTVVYMVTALVTTLYIYIR